MAPKIKIDDIKAYGQEAREATARTQARERNAGEKKWGDTIREEAKSALREAKKIGRKI